MSMEVTVKHARVGGTDPGVWDLLWPSSFIRATLVVGLVLASSSESAGLPKTSGMETRRRLLTQLESRGNAQVDPQHDLGSIQWRSMTPHDETNIRQVGGSRQRQKGFQPQHHNDCVDQAHQRSSAKNNIDRQG